MKATVKVWSLTAAFCFFGQGAKAACEAPETGGKWGLAAQFNLFVEKDLDHTYTQTDGRIAVGGNANFRNYSIGQAITDKLNPYALIVGGDLSFVHGSVWNGHIAVGGTVKAFSHYNVHFNHSMYGGKPLNFATEMARVRDYAGRASRLKAAGNIEWKDKGAVLTALDASPVFYLDGAELSKATYLQIDASRDSSVMINISGKTVALQDFGFRINGAMPERTVFNFYEAENLTLKGIGVVGSVLAPNSDLAFNSAQIQGNVIAKSVKGNGYVRLPHFSGCLP